MRSILLWADLSLPLQDPVAIFTLVLVLILGVPIFFQRIKIPHAIGLILAGMLVGPYGLNILQRDSSIVLFGTVGLLYIMFQSALEIDLREFRQHAFKVLSFGLLTFFLPLIVGTLCGVWLLKFSFLSSLLLASMFSTHTLISYPIAAKYGLSNNRAVTLTVGATLVTDLLALLILAGVSGIAKDELSTTFWIKLGGYTVLFVLVLFLLFPYLIRWALAKLKEVELQALFVLFIVLLSAFLSELAGLEPLIGAFVAGLVLNNNVPKDSPLLSPIKFIGESVFIPFFLIGIGMLVDLAVFGQGWQALEVALVIHAIAFSTKYAASKIGQKLYKLTNAEGRLMFGLSTSHAAATLAIVLVGYNIITGETASGIPIRLLNESVLNGAVILILVSCTLSSFVVDRAAKDLTVGSNR